MITGDFDHTTVTTTNDVPQNAATPGAVLEKGDVDISGFVVILVIVILLIILCKCLKKKKVHPKHPHPKKGGQTMPVSGGQSQNIPMRPQNPAMPMRPQNPTMPMQPQNPTMPMRPQNPTMPMRPQNPTMPMQPQNPMMPIQQNPNIPMNQAPSAIYSQPQYTYPGQQGVNPAQGAGTYPTATPYPPGPTQYIMPQSTVPNPNQS